MQCISVVEATHMLITGPSTRRSVAAERTWSATPSIALARELATKRAEKFLFIMHYSDRSDAELFLRGKLIWSKIGLRTRGPETLLILRDFITTLYLALRLKERFHLFIGVDCLNALAGLVLRKLGFVRKVVFYVIDYVPLRFESPWKNALYHKVDRICACSSDSVWNLSRRMVRIREIQGVPGPRNLYVPVGLYVREVQLQLQCAKPVDQRRLIYIGTIDHYKGIQLAVNAMPEIIKEVPDAQLIVIGTGPLLECLKETVAAKNLEHNVRFLGHLPYEEVFKIFSKGGVGIAPFAPVFTSVYADPAKVKDYLACGCPVLITSVPEASSEIRDRRAGIVINYNREEFINAAVRLLTDKELFAECRVRALELASEYEWRDIFERAFQGIQRTSEKKFSKGNLTNKFWSTNQLSFELQNWQLGYANRINSALRLGPNDLFLDVGCGDSGYALIEASRKGSECVGIDLSRESIEKAHSLLKMNLGGNLSECLLIRCSATHLPFKDQTFSKTASTAVVEHIPKDKLAVKEISRVTKVGGRIMISAPNTYSRTLPVWTALYKIHDKRIGHLRHYKLETLAQEFAKSGCVLLKAVYHAHSVKILQFLLHMFFPIFRKRNSKVWWKLEEIDSKLANVPTGSAFSILMLKCSSQEYTSY